MSPVRMVPSWTRIVATYPRPLSSEDSITVPTPSFFGLALRSMRSVSSRTLSRSLSTFRPFLAEISWHWNFPPQSSTRIFIWESCWRIFSGCAPGLSILLMANTIGTPAACAWLIASMVCGITASSAAMMMMARSVSWAPLARIAVNASCPGVSRKVIFLPLARTTLYAPMCWVIPPASPAITLVLRI